MSAMDAYLGLVGVVLGFILGFGAQWWRERREARTAAALVLGELVSNASALQHLAAGSDLDVRLAVSRDAWDRYSLPLLRIIRGDALTTVYDAYHALDTFEYAAQWLGEQHKAVHALLDEEERKDAELTAGQAEWLKRKADLAIVIGEQRDALAARAPDTVAKLEQAITVLKRYRPFED